MFLKVIMLSLAGFLFFSGCGISNIGRQYEFFEPNSAVAGNIGYLKIFTFNYVEKNEFDDYPMTSIYKGYSIYKRNGDYVLDVRKTLGQPELVKLEEGEYVVIAELQKNIVHSFIVQIQPGKILEIDKFILEKL
jgi:hypothetical protein